MAGWRAVVLGAMLVGAGSVVARGGAEPPETGTVALRDARARGVRDVVFTVRTADGMDIDAKLSVPEGASGRVPVVFYIHGAGPRTYDNAFRYADAEGKVQVGRFMEHHAGEFAKRGIALCRMCKRGCTVTSEPPFMKVDREVFSGATIPVMLDDYERGMAELRLRPEIDARAIVLMGSSEGTRIAPMLAKRSGDGVVGVVIMGYAADNAHATVVWQNSVGPWRNIEHLIPAARGGELTRAEYDEFAKGNPRVAAAIPFGMIDGDGNGRIGAEELARLNKPRLEMILKAVEERNDEFLWKNLLNLSSAYLLDWWEAPPNVENLLALEVPLGIFHGELDGACRVEGVREAQEAFKKAGKTNLTVHIYADGDHDLNWTWHNLTEPGPAPYTDAFDFAASLVSAGGR